MAGRLGAHGPSSPAVLRTGLPSSRLPRGYQGHLPAPRLPRHGLPRRRSARWRDLFGDACSLQQQPPPAAVRSPPAGLPVSGRSWLQGNGEGGAALAQPFRGAWFTGEFSFQQGGWGASLADRLVRKCDVLNRGFSGYNTRWAKIILPRLIRKGNSLDSPVAVTIFFGANDSALKDENPKQHIPLAEYVANLESMVGYLQEAGVPRSRVVLITPPPLCEAAWEQECLLQGCKLNRLNSVVGEYAGACLQVAQDCGVDVLDLWTLMQKDSQDFSSYLSDGLHLSPKGNEFLFSHLWPLIEKKVSSLPLLLPYWRDVAEAKPELSLLGNGDR
ncbi:isoamyl acetate-hydrolyzing esterase 1 homolog isoform X2 [Mirounga angustirostris]|uniref:isoamyl acetate-hydrolyzing esterase 1 homolog isoform X2 n=2 Tax=Mirounga angustirostris TaxID=9716 RepID=UPI001E68806C|nr:isoamyl acetate-hydrolyzing esterase 1 homolog isoform X1 [Mirounga angustirostris]